MRCITVVLLTILWVSLIVCQEEGFHCKPKLGCRIAKCDAAPFGTFGRIEDYLERSEFPISCKFKSDGESIAKMLSQYADVQKEMVDLKTENQLLRTRLQSVESDYKRESRLLRRRLQSMESDSKNDMNSAELQMQEVDGQLAEIKLKVALLELMTPHMEKLELQVRNMEVKIEEREYPSWCASKYNGIKYNGSCLWAEISPPKLYFATALIICNNRAPSKLPEVYGKTEYLKIMEYLRSKIPDGKTFIFAWTEMTRDYSAGKAVLSNGEYAPYTKPRSSSQEWKEGVAGRTQVYLLAQKRISDSDQGMGATWTGYDFSLKPKTVLCQRI